MWTVRQPAGSAAETGPRVSLIPGPDHPATAPSSTPYRLQLSVLEKPGQKATPQRHREQQQEGKGERSRCGLDHPEQCDASQLDAGEQVHSPRLHLGTGIRSHRTAATHTSGDLAPQVPTDLHRHPVRGWPRDTSDPLPITHLPTSMPPGHTLVT